MNRKTALASLALVAAFSGSAFAETPDVFPAQAFTPTQSRAQVQAELAAFQQAGVKPWSIQYNPLRNFRSATTREAVVAEYLASRDATQAMYGEDSGSALLAQGRVPGAVTSTVAGRPVNPQ
jgi:hypothetical protein